MRGCGGVFHAAAHTDQFDPVEVHMRITTKGTENTLAAARAAGVKRFVHVGTEAVFADGNDGEPVEFRDFITKLLATQGVDAGTRNVPRWLARSLVALTAWMKRPPLTRTAFGLIAHEVTVEDAKARRELGYTGAKTSADGLAEMSAR